MYSDRNPTQYLLTKVQIKNYAKIERHQKREPHTINQPVLLKKQKYRPP